MCTKMPVMTTITGMLKRVEPLGEPPPTQDKQSG